MTAQHAIDFLKSIHDDIGEIKLTSGETIVNMRKFKESHISRLNNINTDSLFYTSNLDRVIKLKNILNSKSDEKTNYQKTENKESKQQTLSLF